MSDMVQTIFGLIPRDKLDVAERISEDGRARVVKTVWTLREDIVVERDGERFHLTFTYPAMQNPDGSLIPDSERTVVSTKGTIAREDGHVMAKRGIEAVPSQGFLNQ